MHRHLFKERLQCNITSLAYDLRLSYFIFIYLFLLQLFVCRFNIYCTNTNNVQDVLIILTLPYINQEISTDIKSNVLYIEFQGKRFSK